ncbi:hypothetical protein GCM10009760_53680 [Kitasatospora kazusensis]|uniref:Uncharacterized protein n=1 Tax=Kitasatospora kazusensis TaxID=407974 RepID=A0ABN3A6G4_9ACTN
MIRWLWGRWARLEMWWGLQGQFSRPALLVSPRRRSAHERAAARVAEPGYREAALLRLTAAARLRELGIDARVPVMSEAELFHSIFGCEWEDWDPDRP